MLPKQYKEAIDYVSSKVDFDFRAFLARLEPAPSFDEPLGPSPQCLSVEQIRSFCQKEKGSAEESEIVTHLAACDVCLSFSQAYANAKVGGMPQELYDQISERLKNKTGSTRRSWEAAPIWPLVENKLKWIAVPALALILWIVHPYTAPYWQEALSHGKQAWHAMLKTDRTRREEARAQFAKTLQVLAGDIPNDLDVVRNSIDIVKTASTQMTFEPHDYVVVETARANLEKRWEISQQQGQAELAWHTFNAELAAVETIARYEHLRTSVSSSATLVPPIYVKEFSVADGIPRVVIEGGKFRDASVRTLMKQSFRQTTGISRLDVYHGNRFLYTLQR